LVEIRGLLAGLPFQVVSLADIDLAQHPEEDGLEAFDSFEQNALAKARYYSCRTGMATIADDSGLCVDALGGGPGVRSRRFAPNRESRGRDQDAANNTQLLRQLEGLPQLRRTAHYRCSLALVAKPLSLITNGRVDGIIAEAQRGESGFGYDPLFIVPAYGRTFGELPAEVKAVASHRAAAVLSLRGWLTAPTGARGVLPVCRYPPD
jgi:XTP/dITP diphosphohydrolase